jgi:iron complex outermembrane receptor protein
VQCTPYTSGRRASTSFPSPVRRISCKAPADPTPRRCRLNVANLLSYLKSLNGKANPGACPSLPCASPYDFSATLPQANPFNSYDVRERTYSFYVEGTFDGNLFGNDWSGNLGVRVIRTSDHRRHVTERAHVWAYSAANATQSFNVDYSAATAFSRARPVHGSLALPEFELLAAAENSAAARRSIRDMSRPDLNQLAPNATNQAINGTPELDYSGAAGLKPIKANAADFSPSGTTSRMRRSRLRCSTSTSRMTSIPPLRPT